MMRVMGWQLHAANLEPCRPSLQLRQSEAALVEQRRECGGAVRAGADQTCQACFHGGCLEQFHAVATSCRTRRRPLNAIWMACLN